jgi:hypothetical protein
VGFIPHIRNFFLAQHHNSPIRNYFLKVHEFPQLVQVDVSITSSAATVPMLKTKTPVIANIPTAITPIIHKFILLSSDLIKNLKK